jgi:hypothetical protein
MGIRAMGIRQGLSSFALIVVIAASSASMGGQPGLDPVADWRVEREVDLRRGDWRSWSP